MARFPGLSPATINAANSEQPANIKKWKKTNSEEKKVVSTAFKIAAVRIGQIGRDFGYLGKEAGAQWLIFLHSIEVFYTP